MKLYATIASERASKGQGGNKYLEIEITGELQERLAIITVKPYSDCEKAKIELSYCGENTRIATHDMTEESNWRKGEKQKTAKKETCEKHGTQYMERHKLDGHYICRACVVESIK